MAKFRKKRSSSRRAKFGRRSSSKGVNPLMVVLPAVAYGAGRGYLSSMIEPITSKVPLGTFADEAVFGVAGYLMAKKGKGIVKNLGMAVLTVEAASVGSQIVNKAAPASNGHSSTYEY